jgi:hypothetical protein
MRTVNTLRHVPWTCLWGRFGETTSSWPTLSRRFVFWTCARPGARKYLTRGSCEDCPYWEPTSSLPPADQEQELTTV